jgi:glucosamine-6-phosphate deaminase
VQLDEYFPMNPKYECSFDYFVKKYYIGAIGFDLRKALTINACIVESALGQLRPDRRDLGRIFPDGAVDLGLRTKPASTKEEEVQKECIMLIDRGCETYEETIRQMGGIGFFLGGIGPDGHIAFNIRGSSFFSHTRLTAVNYETHAAAAADLGGIENVRKKAVITIGLGTIIFNAGATAIVMASGEAKAEVVANTLERGPSIVYPASCLSKLSGARFFLTEGAASRLKMRTTAAILKERDASGEVIEKLLIDGAVSRPVPDGASVKRGPSLPEEWRLAEKLTGLTAKVLNEQKGPQ